MTVTELKHQAKLQEWREKIKECRSSELPVKEWCREQRINPTTYYRWEREIFGRVKCAQEPGTSLVASETVFAQLPAPKGSSPGISVMTVRMGGMEIDVHAGADAEMLASLFRVLKQC